MPIESKEEVEYCKLQVQYVAPQDVVKEKRAAVLKQFKKMPVSGFRPGKASDQALKIKYKKQIEASVQRELVSHAYDDILFETGISPIGFPNITDTKLQGVNFSCNMLFMKKPEFELKQYSGFEIPSPHLPKNSVELAEEMLQNLRLQHGDVCPYEDGQFVQVGDKITMSYELQQEGKEKIIKEGEVHVVRQSEFDDSILGMLPDETREFTILDQKKERVGVKVTLHMGLKNVPCSDNEALATKVGYESFEKLREALVGTASGSIEQQKSVLLVDQIKKRVLEAHDFEVPSWLALMEAQSMAQQERVNWDAAEESAKEDYINKASERVKLSFIFDSIRKAEPEAQMSDEEVREYLSNLIAMRGQDPHKVLVEAERTGKLFGMVASVRDEVTSKWLLQNSKIIE